MILLFPVLGKNNQISWIPLRFFFFFFKCHRSFSPYAHLSLVPWTLRMRFRTRSFSGRERHECNITFSQLSNVLLRAQNLPFLSFYSQNMTLYIADPRSMQDACHIWTSYSALLTLQSLWLSYRASEHGIRRSRLGSSWALFFFVQRAWQDEKHLYLFSLPFITIFSCFQYGRMRSSLYPTRHYG